MDSFRDIVVWRPVTAITGSAYLVSAVFDPSLCQIIGLQQGKRFACSVADTGKYDGNHRCIIDKIAFDDGRTLFVATLPIAWAGTPQRPGRIKFL